MVSRSPNLISFYPNDFSEKLIIAESYLLGLSKSSRVNMIVKKHQDSLGEDEKKKLIDIYNSLSDEEKKRPKSSK